MDILLPWLHDLEKADGFGLAKIVLKYVLNRIQNNNEQLFIQKIQQYLSNELKGEAMTLAERFKEIGKEEGIEEVALNLLKQGIKENIIAQATNLSLTKLFSLKEQLKSEAN